MLSKKTTYVLCSLFCALGLVTAKVSYADQTNPEIFAYAAPVYTGASLATGSSVKPINTDNEKINILGNATLDTGFIMPDQAGNLVHIQGETRTIPKASNANARELKLKIRELAEQLISGIHDPSLNNAVALPVSFVNMDNLKSTSTFGRYIAEQLYHEFTLRNFPIIEYRTLKNITVRDGEGEFYLGRAIQSLALPKNAVVVAGTYYNEGQSIFLNARLVRPYDGKVLRTANLVFDANKLTSKMLAQSTVQIERGSLTIKDYQDTVAPTRLDPFDLGEDIH